MRAAYDTSFQTSGRKNPAAKRSLEQLVASGTVHYAYVGVTTSDLTPTLARRFGYPVLRGAVVNVVREKQKTNIRTHAADDAVKLPPPRELTIESSIEMITDDELVEITPGNLRIRKRKLREQDRRRG